MPVPVVATRRGDLRRRGRYVEALAPQWSDVDLERGLLRVRGTLSRIDGRLVVTGPKPAKSERFVPVSEPARRLRHKVQNAQAEERRAAGSAWHQTGYVWWSNRLRKRSGAVSDLSGYGP